MCNLNAWIQNRNKVAPGDPVPAAVVMLVSCVGGYAVSFKKQKKEMAFPTLLQPYGRY